MKLVREHIILEKFTEDDTDPIKDLGIGLTVCEIEFIVKLSFWNRKKIDSSEHWILEPLEEHNIEYEVINPGNSKQSVFPRIRFTGTQEDMIDFIMHSRLMAPLRMNKLSVAIWGYDREETAKFIKDHPPSYKDNI